jgi:hypothetical protein
MIGGILAPNNERFRSSSTNYSTIDANKALADLYNEFSFDRVNKLSPFRLCVLIPKI